MPIDYTGQQGGILAMAFAAGCAMTTAFWLGIAATIWRLFYEPRIAELKKERDDGARACAAEMAALRKRIAELETITIMHAGSDLSEAVRGSTVKYHEGGYWEIGARGTPERWIEGPAKAEKNDEAV